MVARPFARPLNRCGPQTSETTIRPSCSSTHRRVIMHTTHSAQFGWEAASDTTRHSCASRSRHLRSLEGESRCRIHLAPNFAMLVRKRARTKAYKPCLQTSRAPWLVDSVIETRFRDTTRRLPCVARKAPQDSSSQCFVARQAAYRPLTWRGTAALTHSCIGTSTHGSCGPRSANKVSST